MKSRPILFSAPMIRAILSGSKNQTRRVVSKNGWDSDYDFRELRDGRAHFYANRKPKRRELLMPSFGVDCRFGVAGDQLWCRETWAPRGVNQIGGGPLESLIAYRADGAMHTFPHHEIARMVGEWKPSIFMPRWASRITLEITDVLVERLQDISEEDAIAEGAHRKIWITSPMSAGAMNARGDYGTHREGYKEIWEDINGVGSWALSPWVWAISFRRV